MDKVASVNVAKIRLMAIREDLPWAIEKLSRIEVIPALDLACLESDNVPLNSLFVYFDPTVRGRVMVRHHRDDWEAVNTLLVECGMKLSGFNVVGRNSQGEIAA